MADTMQFVATIAHQGEMRVIVIPKRMHEKVSSFEGDQVKITIEKI